MSTKNLTYSIGADLGQLRRDMDAAGTLTRRWQRELDSLEAKQQQHRQTLDDLGRGYTAFGAAVTLGLGIATKAAIDWESAFTGVKKTVDGSEKDYANLEAELRKLARTLPTAHKEIAAVAEAAGQLGIKRNDIAEFTKVMIDLGNTTNLTAEDAATGLAKFSNIMGTSSKDADRLGSSLVALGNDGASTEQDILAMALRIAGAGNQIGLAEGQVLGFASALSSVGIEAEAGGSSISRVMISIEQAVRGGSKSLDGFAQVAGMSADEFAKKYKQDAGAAIVEFIAGLSRMQKAGGDVFGVLERLGFSEILVRDALLRSAGASDMLTKSLQVGTKAWADNTALLDEANKRYETSASKLKVAGNQITDSLIDVGASLAPIAVTGAQAISDLVRWFQALPGPVKDVVTWVGAGAAAVTLFGGAALIAVPKVLVFRESMTTLAATGGAMATGLSRVGMFLTGPWGAALGAGVLALGLFGATSGSASRKQEELQASLKDVAVQLRENNGLVNDSIRASVAKVAQDTKWGGGMDNVLSKSKKLGIELSLVTDAILGQGDASDRVMGQLNKMIEAGAKARADWQKTGTYQSQSDRELGERAAGAELLRQKLEMLGGQFKEQAKSEAEIAAATKTAAGTTQEQAAATNDLGKAAEDAAKELDSLLKALDAINGTTLSYRDAQREYLQTIEDTAAAAAKSSGNLDINTKAGRENAAQLDKMAKSANDLAEAAAREAQQTGGAAAGAAALRNSLEASRPELEKMARTFGMSEEAAKKYVDQVLGIPSSASTDILTPGSAAAYNEMVRVRDAVKNVPPTKEVNVGVISAEAQKTLSDLGYKVRTLPDGTVVVTGNTDPAQRDLDRYIDRNKNRSISVAVTYSAPGGKAVGLLNNAYGNVVSFENGGMFEHHRPQIAKAQRGTVRVWAEENTRKESYIPWNLDRRAAATGVLDMTADGFGYRLVPKSAFGMPGAFYGGGAMPGRSVASTPQQVTVNGPQTLVILDADGQLIGRMRVEADRAVAAEGRTFNLMGRG